MDSPELTTLEYAKLCAGIGRKSFGYDGSVEFRVSEDPDFLTNNREDVVRICRILNRSWDFVRHLSTEEGILQIL